MTFSLNKDLHCFFNCVWLGGGMCQGTSQGTPTYPCEQEEKERNWSPESQRLTGPTSHGLSHWAHAP